MRRVDLRSRFLRMGLAWWASVTCMDAAFGQEPAPILAVAPAVHPLQEQLQVTQLLQAIEPYRPHAEIQGNAILAGSTTMQLLGQSWSTRFKLFHPKVEFTRGADGTDAGLEALSKDANTIVGISRSVTEEDLAKLKAGACKDPIVVIVALDPLAVYVHKDNPIGSLAPEQIQKLFSAGADGKPSASRWGEFGVQGPIADKPIRIHQRSEVSGTRNFIKASILGGSNLAEPVATHTSNAEICKALADDPSGVGMCGFGDGNDGVRAVPLLINQHIVPATASSFLAGAYPMVRPLSLVFDRTLLAKDQGLREAIIRYILSRDGQAEAIRAGFFPLDPNFVRQEIVQVTGTQFR